MTVKDFGNRSVAIGTRDEAAAIQRGDGQPVFAIVNLSRVAAAAPWVQVPEFLFPLWDEDSHDCRGVGVQAAHTTAWLLDQAGNATVLVCCGEGRSRSPLIAACALHMDDPRRGTIVEILEEIAALRTGVNVRGLDADWKRNIATACTVGGP